MNPASGSPDGPSASERDRGGGFGFRATVYLSIGLSAGTVPSSETRNDLTAIQLALAEEH